jgi:hypothetical protein
MIGGGFASKVFLPRTQRVRTRSDSDGPELRTARHKYAAQNAGRKLREQQLVKRETGPSLSLRVLTLRSAADF